MSSVASFVLRGLNRKKAALLVLEAKHAALDLAAPRHQPGERSRGCDLCFSIGSLRAEVAAAEVALKQAEGLR